MFHLAKIYLKHSCKNVFILLSTQTNSVDSPRRSSLRCEKLEAALPLARDWLVSCAVLFSLIQIALPLGQIETVNLTVLQMHIL